MNEEKVRSILIWISAIFLFIFCLFPFVWMLIVSLTGAPDFLSDKSFYSFTLKNYEDVNQVLDALREGYTIAIIDIKTLRKKDSIELKRAISKIKKTTDALEGSIAGFGENIVIVTP